MAGNRESERDSDDCASASGFAGDCGTDRETVSGFEPECGCGCDTAARENRGELRVAVVDHVWRGCARVADCMRECGEFAAGKGDGAAQRSGSAERIGSRTRAAGAPIVDGEFALVTDWWGAGAGACVWRSSCPARCLADVCTANKPN